MYILENLFSFLPLPLCFFLLRSSSPTIYPFIDSKTPIRYWGNKSAAHIPPELFQYKSYRKKSSLPTRCKILQESDDGASLETLAHLAMQARPWQQHTEFCEALSFQLYTQQPSGVTVLFTVPVLREP